MNTPDLQHMMQVLKARRNSLGYSFQDLADLTGMSRSTLQRYETGGIRNIPLQRVQTLARALGTTPEHLMGWDSQDVQTAPSEAALRRYFLCKTGRMPTEEELRRLDDFAEIFIRGMEKRI